MFEIIYLKQECFIFVLVYTLKKLLLAHRILELKADITLVVHISPQSLLNSKIT